MENLVFIGSEATGYYGGAYDCFGVFVSKEMYEKYREELETAFRYRNHGELDGKYSEVEGNLIVEEVKDELKIVELVYGKQIDYEVYHFSEYAEDYDDEIVNELFEHIDNITDKVYPVVNRFGEYSFILTEEEYKKVLGFVENLRRSE